MRNRYRNPPLIEAVCEFRFDASSPWDLAIPGSFYEEVKNSYPVKRPIASVELVLQSSPNQQGTTPAVVQMDRIQFLGQDEKSVLLLGPHVLSVHRLAPYTSWEDFEPSIAKALGVYRKVATPKEIGRVGLKFQNLINIPQSVIRMEDYFTFYPALGDKLPQTHTSFLVGVVIPFDTGESQLRLELQSGMSSKGNIASVLLTLDYYSAKKVEWDDLRKWVETGHARIEDVFEGCLLDSTRSLFDPTGS
jgi:uncharacterized protein (TIGR04255 family)